MSEVTLTRVFDASPEELFRAFTDPGELGRWFGPGRFHVPRADVDLRPGGSYRFELHAPEGDVLVLAGEYEVVEAPRRLVFTWRWEAGWSDPAVTRVSVEFRAASGGTEVVLVHGELEGDDAMNSHRMGWESGLDKLRAAIDGG